MAAPGEGTCAGTAAGVAEATVEATVMEATAEAAATERAANAVPCQAREQSLHSNMAWWVPSARPAARRLLRLIQGAWHRFQAPERGRRPRATTAFGECQAVAPFDSQ